MEEQSNLRVYIIDVYFDFRDSVGNSQYVFLIHAHTKRQAMGFLLNYLEDQNFMMDRIDRYDVRVLNFDNSNVEQMRS